MFEDLGIDTSWLKSLSSGGGAPKITVQSTNAQGTDITVSPIMSLSSPGSPSSGGGYDMGPSVSTPIAFTDQSGRGTSPADLFLPGGSRSVYNPDLMKPAGASSDPLSWIMDNPLMILLLVGGVFLLTSK